MRQAGSFPMHHKHRVELLHQGRTPEFEYWANQDHSLYLCKKKSEDVWMAIVDGDVVLDRSNPFDDDAVLYPVAPLTAPAADGLVPLLAMQERIHILLDLDQAWEETGPLRLQPRRAPDTVDA